MRTHPTRKTLLAATIAIISRQAEHPALTTDEQFAVQIRLSEFSLGQAIFCAGWLILKTEERPDALRQVLARTKPLNETQHLLYRQMASYVRCPHTHRLVIRPGGDQRPVSLRFDVN